MADETLEKIQADLEVLKKENESLKSTNTRILDESVSFKKRAQEAESKLSEAEKKKLEDEGKLQERLDQEKKENLEKDNRIKTLTNTTLKKDLRAEVAKHAKDAHDIDVILKITEHKDLLKLDEENLTVSGVEDFVKKVRETHSFLFAKNKLPGTETKKPDGKDFQNPDNRTEYEKEISAAKTQADVEAVAIKYGKAK